MARRKKKNSHVYWICMGIYAIVLIAMMLFNWSPRTVAWKEKMAAKLKRTKKEEA